MISEPPEKVREELKQFYKTSRAYSEHLAMEGETYFKRYLALIDRYAPGTGTVLDAGCGTGLSTRLLARKGRRAFGVDLSPFFLSQGNQTPAERNAPAPLTAGDILSLPFRDGVFDLVASYLVFEFVPDPAKGLEEMSRVLKKGGILLIITPNLLSPIWPLGDFFRMLAGGPSRPVWCETPLGAFSTFWRNLTLSLRKRFQTEPEFLYREPDLSCKKVVGRDSDSVYLISPTDLERFLRKRGFRILRTGSRSLWVERLFPFLASSVEFVARKN